MIGAVVLSYQKAWIFKRFMGSLLGQTRPPDQIVVVDDGSTDGSHELALELVPSAPAGLVIRTNRIGQSAARNRGLELLDRSMDQVIFLDGDLILQINMLGRMEMELAEHRDVSFVYSHYNRTGVIEGRVLAKPWDPDILKAGNFISPMSLCRRYHLPIPCFDENLERYEDWDLWLRMAKNGRKGRLIDEMLFTAHYREGDLSAKGESQDHFWAIKQKHRI